MRYASSGRTAEASERGMRTGSVGQVGCGREDRVLSLQRLFGRSLGVQHCVGYCAILLVLMVSVAASYISMGLRI